MRRVIITVSIKKGICVFLTLLAFMILLPVLIVGVGTDKGLIDSRHLKDKPSGFNIKPNNIIFDESNSGGPRITVYRTKEDKIEELNLEEYVRGVVAGEMPAEFEFEALKAQAVAARTYILSHLQQYKGRKCSLGKGADICDTVHCQVYKSREERFAGWQENKRGLYWNKITDAVKDTIGQVLTYDGQLAMNIRYFSTSSGLTEDAVEVFGINAPYLKSVKSDGEEISPRFTDTRKITYNELAGKINNAYPQAKVSSGKLKSQIMIVSRSAGKSVKELKLGNTTVTGPQFRSLLGLNSANFQFKFNSNDVEIITYGYGHGLGMSQWGANVMAKKGKHYKEILTHYYQGVEVEIIYK
jgi:stage II sporulation protein D